MSLHATNSRTALLDISLSVAHTLILSGGGIHLNKPFRGTRFVPPQSEGNTVVQRCLGPKIRPSFGHFGLLWVQWTHFPVNFESG